MIELWHYLSHTFHALLISAFFMRPSRLLPLLLLPLFTTFSCSKKTDQEQAQTKASADGEEIDPYQNITFAFDEPVAPATPEGNWDTTRYVQFEPAIKGRFKWANEGRELVFSPYEPLRPSTVFQASLRSAALPSGKQSLTLDRTKFHTPLVALGGRQAGAPGWSSPRSGP